MTLKQNLRCVWLLPQHQILKPRNLNRSMNGKQRSHLMRFNRKILTFTLRLKSCCYFSFICLCVVYLFEVMPNGFALYATEWNARTKHTHINSVLLSFSCVSLTHAYIYTNFWHVYTSFCAHAFSQVVNSGIQILRKWTLAINFYFWFQIDISN